MQKYELPKGPLPEDTMIRIARELQTAARRGINGKWVVTVIALGDGYIKVQEARPPNRMIRVKR